MAMSLCIAGCVEVAALGGGEPSEPGSGGSGGTGGSGGSGGIGGTGGSGGGHLPVCTPATPSPCARIERIEAGGTFNCGIFDDGTTRCFGYNDSHQLGDPTLSPSVYGSGVAHELLAPKALSLGQHHGCALDGTDLRCWGRNNLGQLGTGDAIYGSEPRFVLAGADEVSTLSRSTCARVGGGVLCWGVLLNGQAWLGTEEGEYTATPTPLAELAGVTRVVVGSMFGCAVVGTDGVVCWGRGIMGQLGNGDTADSAEPVSVSGLAAPVKALAAGGEHVCALAGEPALVHCWGRFPHIGPANTEAAVLPVQPDGEVVEIGSGWRHSCVLLTDGRVQCWGIDLHGELGHGKGDSEAPVTVVGLSDVVDLAVGFQHNCALRATGDLVCWGRNEYHQLGNGSDGDYEPTPVPVVWDSP